MSRSRWLVPLAVIALFIGGAVYFGYAQYLQGQREVALNAARGGDFDWAEPQLKACLARAPTDVDVLRALAKGYLNLARRGEAEECLTRWLDQTPNDAEALQLRLDLYRDLARYDAAIADLDRLIALDPENPALPRRKPGLLFSAGQFAEADSASANWPALNS